MTKYQKYKKYEQTEKRKKSKRFYSHLYYLRNREKHIRAVNEYNKKHPEYPRMCARLRYYREKGIVGKHTLKEWEALKKRVNYTCLCCGKSEPKIRLTEDHIIPISQGGTNYISNIQPLCQSCNSKKWVKTIYFLPQMGSLILERC